MRPYILSETNWKTVKSSEYKVVILPWGATEAHNYHLPYSTDFLQAEAIAHEAARLAWDDNVHTIVLPAIPYGVNTGQMDVPLDINMHPSTQLAVLSDMIESLHSQGYYKLVILNGHGGNDFKPMLRELGVKYPNMILAVVDWFRMKEHKEIFENPGDHAGELETSVLMHLKPEWVLPLDEAGNGDTKKQMKYAAMKEGWAWAERKWNEVSYDTGIGNPKKATAEKGEQLFKLATRKVADFLIELAETDSVKEMYE